MCLPVIYTIRYTELEHWTIFFSVLLKFFSSINFYIINLQQIEIFPTCMRQIGISVGSIFANVLGIFVPSIVNLVNKLFLIIWLLLIYLILSIFQGTVYDIRYPFIILTVMYLIGTVIAMFVPETLHQKLPDTLEEAKVFGIGQVRYSFAQFSIQVLIIALYYQKFWSFPRKSNKVSPANFDTKL